MGYRSEVHFTVVGPREQMMVHLTTYRLTVPNSAEALADCRFFVKDNQLVVKFYGNDVKWYEDYEDVKALTAL